MALLLGTLFVISSAAPIPRRGLDPRAANSKRGIALSETGSAHLSHITNSAVSWLYNWANERPAGLSSEIEYVPMQWGAEGIETFAGAVSGAKHVLGFNEPELSGQSNIDAGKAAALWKEYMNPLHSAGIKIGAPAISSAPEGAVWLENFFNACNKGCHVDFIPIHWYGEGSDNFLAYLSKMDEQFGQYGPLWVTEFGDTTMSNPAIVQSFLETTTSAMDGLSYVARYAWFDYSPSTPDLETNMLDSGGNLNALGSAYVS